MAREKAKKKFGIETVGDERVTVYIAPDGRFTATHHEKEMYSETLQGLLDAVKRTQRVKKAKIEIPATHVKRRRHGYGDPERTELVDIILTGVHGRTSEILWREVESGETGRQRGYYGGDNILAPMNADEKKQFVALEAAEHAAEKKFREFKKKFEINAPRLIEAAVKKAEEGES